MTAGVRARHLLPDIDAMVQITRLLTLLVTGDRASLEGALHEDVVFVQADGREHTGRAAVLSVFEGADHGASYQVLDQDDEEGWLRVGLRVADPPVMVAFVLRGRLLEDRLVEVRVEP
jgi:hypothetical protein